MPLVLSVVVVRMSCPEGGGKSPILPREIVGNHQLESMCELCRLLREHHGHYSVEQPVRSLLFHTAAFKQLASEVDMYCAHLCQCAYQLQLPGADRHLFCKKETLIYASYPEITSLSLMCPGKGPLHRHQICWGSAKVNGKTISLARCERLSPSEGSSAVTEIGFAIGGRC